MSCWPSFTVEELITKGIIERPMDGNHGSIHPKSTDYVDDGIPFVMASDLADGRVNTRECAFISEKHANTLRKGFARTGDVLLSHKATIGRVAIVRRSAYPFVMLTPQVTYYRVADDSALNNVFLYYYFQSRDFLDVLEQWAGAGSTRAYLGITGQKKLPIALPPIQTQNEIAAILGTLDDKIELNRNMAATLEEMARTLYRSWFVDFDPVRARAEGRTPAHMDTATAAIFPASLGEDGLPVGWEERGLDEIAEFVNGAALQKYPAAEGEPSLTVIKIAELRSGVTAASSKASAELPDKYKINDGDVLFSWSGSLLQKVWVDGPGALNQHLFKVTSSHVPQWFHFYAVDWHMDEFRMIAASKATTMGHIQRHHLAEAKTSVPSAAVLDVADDAIRPLFDAAVQRHLENRTLATLRDTLLPRLMSGELRVSAARELVKEFA